MKHIIKKDLVAFIKQAAYQMRESCIVMTAQAGSGHLTSALSAADIIAALFFGVMKFDPNTPNNIYNDRFILSKGHAAPALYAVWHELGKISKDELLGYRSINSPLEGHPTPRFWGSNAATGSLGQGLSIGVGFALQAHLDTTGSRTFILMGDGEIAEGSVWEAAQIASYYQIDNLVGIIDANRLAQSGESLYGANIELIAQRFEAFGWHTITIDGHDILQIIEACAKAEMIKKQPTMIIAHTYKGYSLPSLQDKENFHGKAPQKSEVNALIAELNNFFQPSGKKDFQWHQNFPAILHPKQNFQKKQIEGKTYTIGEQHATRHAWVDGVCTAAAQNQNIIVFDADVKNSTGSDQFEKMFPDRFIQSFIAEQNMIGMAIGMAKNGKIPFVATFGAFFSRAHDQIRMAAIGRVPLRLVGTHAGVAIGQDGPSQMALEDIALMRALIDSYVLYPADAISAQKLVGCMLQYDHGISYLRTTRNTTPVIYTNSDVFYIGGFNIIRSSSNDQLCIISAGITLFETLKAYDYCAQKGIHIAIFDLYCIKPIDEEKLIKAIRAHGNRVITVEDHYAEGGLGEAVAAICAQHSIHVEILAVRKLPKSGATEDLLDYENISFLHIIKKALELKKS